MNALLVIFFQRGFKVYYWLISPLLGSRCRFAPSCSEYAHQALDQHGVLKGLGLTMLRLGRCHPWGGSGIDPVPPCNSPIHTRCNHSGCHKVTLDPDSKATN